MQQKESSDHRLRYVATFNIKLLVHTHLGADLSGSSAQLVDLGLEGGAVLLSILQRGT